MLKDQLQLREATFGTDKLQSSLVELKDQNHQNNLRLVNLPENEKGDDAIGFLEQQIPVWFPSLAGQGAIEIERAHHVFRMVKIHPTNPEP